MRHWTGRDGSASIWFLSFVHSRFSGSSHLLRRKRTKKNEQGSGMGCFFIVLDLVLLVIVTLNYLG